MKKVQKSKKTTKTNNKGLCNVVKSVGWMAILESFVIGLLGLILVMNPNGTAVVIACVIGAFLVIKGLYRIVNYFTMKGQYDLFNNDLLYGIVALLAGVAVLFMGSSVETLLRWIVGIWMIYAALIRLNTAIKMRAAKIKSWMYALLVSLIMLAIGVYVLAKAGAVLEIIGWTMVITAMLGILNDLIFIKNIDSIFKKR